MSNYPAGVTGHEPQIAGYATGEASVDCETENVRGVPLALVTDFLDQFERTFTAPGGGLYSDRPEHLVRDDAARFRVLLNAAREALRQAEGEHVECLFSGEVEADVEYGTRYWTCPWCDTEHQDNIEE